MVEIRSPFHNMYLRYIILDAMLCQVWQCETNGIMLLAKHYQTELGVIFS